MNRGRLRIENVEIRDTAGEGIGLREVELVDVRFCTVINAGGAGISIRGISDDFTGSIVGNTVTSPIGDGIVLFGLRGGEVLDNHVQGHGTAASAVGIWLDGVVAGGGNRIAGNTVVGGGGDDEGMVLDVDSADNLVLRNVISDNGQQGIRALSDRNVMAGNVVRNNGREGIKVTGSRCDVSRNEVTDNGRDGIFVGGDFNLVRDNVSAGNNGFGIRWDTNNNHAYRDNMLLDNTSGGVGGPGGATDAGGNI